MINMPFNWDEEGNAYNGSYLYNCCCTSNPGVNTALSFVGGGIPWDNKIT